MSNIFSAFTNLHRYFLTYNPALTLFTCVCHTCKHTRSTCQSAAVRQFAFKQSFFPQIYTDFLRSYSLVLFNVHCPFAITHRFVRLFQSGFSCSLSPTFRAQPSLCYVRSGTCKDQSVDHAAQTILYGPRSWNLAVGGTHNLLTQSMSHLFHLLSSVVHWYGTLVCDFRALVHSCCVNGVRAPSCPVRT